MYSAVVLLLDVSEEGGVAEVGLAAGTDIVPVVGVIPGPPAVLLLHELVLVVSVVGEHPVITESIIRRGWLLEG